MPTLRLISQNDAVIFGQALRQRKATSVAYAMKCQSGISWRELKAKTEESPA